MHALVQDGHDADVAIREHLPVDEMPVVAADMAVDAEFRRNSTSGEASGRDRLETREQAAGAEVDFIQALARADLDTECGHTASARALRPFTESASSGR
jgi:hypothetical protein